MDQDNLLTRVREIERQIAALPRGSLTVKKVNGREYHYHRWTENKKRHEKYLPFEEVEGFRQQIAHRKELEGELKKLRRGMPHIPYQYPHRPVPEEVFRTCPRIRKKGMLSGAPQLPLWRDTG